MKYKIVETDEGRFVEVTTTKPYLVEGKIIPAGKVLLINEKGILGTLDEEFEEEAKEMVDDCKEKNIKKAMAEEPVEEEASAEEEVPAEDEVLEEPEEPEFADAEREPMEVEVSLEGEDLEGEEEPFEGEEDFEDEFADELPEGVEDYDEELPEGEEGEEDLEGEKDPDAEYDEEEAFDEGELDPEVDQSEFEEEEVHKLPMMRVFKRKMEEPVVEEPVVKPAGQIVTPKKPMEIEKDGVDEISIKVKPEEGEEIAEPEEKKEMRRPVRRMIKA